MRAYRTGGKGADKNLGVEERVKNRLKFWDDFLMVISYRGWFGEKKNERVYNVKANANERKHYRVKERNEKRDMEKQGGKKTSGEQLKKSVMRV